MKFKVGDKVRVKPGGLGIWIKTGKTYEVLGTLTEPGEPPKRMKRYVPPGVEVDCDCDMCTKPKPERHFVIVKNEFGKEGQYFEGCFETG
jgi:hypothetical protein